MMGAIFMKFGRAPAMRSINTVIAQALSAFCNSMLTRLTSRISSSGMGAGWPCFIARTKVLAHLRKAFPAPAAQPAEVIKLQHLASAEHLQAFLGETPVAVGQVMDGAHGTVGELQRDRDLVVGNLQRGVSVQRHDPVAHDRRPGQVAQQINEVATLAHDAPAPHGLVLRPMV